MVRNADLNAEVWDIIHNQHWAAADVATRLGVSPTNFHRILKRDQIQKSFVDLLEVLGYDIEIKFVRRKGRYALPESAPHGLEDLNRRQKEDLIRKLQESLETEK